LSSRGAVTWSKKRVFIEVFDLFFISSKYDKFNSKADWGEGIFL